MSKFEAKKAQDLKEKKVKDMKRKEEAWARSNSDMKARNERIPPITVLRTLMVDGEGFSHARGCARNQIKNNVLLRSTFFFFSFARSSVGCPGVGRGDK